MDKKVDISVLVAARDEYIEQLKCIISPLLIQGFNSIYSDAIEITHGKRVIYKFQELLKEIPNWNQTILQEESKRIKKKCSYIMDIVTAIFVSNVKILASIRLKGSNENIRVKIPTSDIFIHSIYIEAAQHIFYDPFLFYHHTNRSIQENKETVRKIIRNSIDETIRQMLPFDDILQEYLANALNDSDSDSEVELTGKNIVGPDPESEESEESDSDDLDLEGSEEGSEESDSEEPEVKNINGSFYDPITKPTNFGLGELGFGEPENTPPSVQDHQLQPPPLIPQTPVSQYPSALPVVPLVQPHQPVAPPQPVRQSTEPSLAPSNYSFF